MHRIVIERPIEKSIDKRQKYTDHISTLGGFVVVAISDSIIDRIFKHMVFAPVLSIFHKIKNMIVRRIGATREQRIQSAMSQIQESFRGSDKKFVYLVAFDMLACYTLIYVRRSFIDEVIAPTMFYLNNKCFSNYIADNVIRNLCHQNGHYFNSMYLCAMFSITNRMYQIAGERGINLGPEEVEEDQEMQQPEIDVIEEAQEFRQEDEPRELIEFREGLIAGFEHQRQMHRNRIFQDMLMFTDIFRHIAVEPVIDRIGNL